jgi:cytochrome c oxidase subunit 2
MDRKKMAVLTLLGLSPVALFAALHGIVRDTNSILATQEIEVTAKKYEFSPNPIKVKKGEPVKLTITATDHDHGFSIDAFKIKQKLKKGEPSIVEFTPDKAGTFPFKCSVVCGIGHHGMKGTIVVEE